MHDSSCCSRRGAAAVARTLTVRRRAQVLTHSGGGVAALGAVRVALPVLLLRTGDAQGALEAAVGGLAWLRDRQVGLLAAAAGQTLSFVCPPPLGLRRRTDIQAALLVPQCCCRRSAESAAACRRAWASTLWAAAGVQKAAAAEGGGSAATGEGAGATAAGPPRRRRHGAAEACRRVVCFKEKRDAPRFCRVWRVGPELVHALLLGSPADCLDVAPWKQSSATFCQHLWRASGNDRRILVALQRERRTHRWRSQ